ncbi:hypothetical protein Prudu_002068 [Prunus dulcis]|uniref:Uncharacterized protein n=1 Tax=Prunus dulcis TaxID=3755 RepID=A0A4Y1QPZ8_PRUDU|nr:hypothetical protein Prudu_002068 [Prunus dulcis]
MATGPVVLEPPSSPPPFPTGLNPGVALSWPKTVFSDGGSFEVTRTSSLRFSLVSPPNRSSIRSPTKF